MRQLKRYLSNLPLLIFLVFCFDVYKNSQTFIKYVGVSPYFLASIAVLFTFIFRINKKFINKKAIVVTVIVAVITGVFGVFFNLLELVTPANYVYSKFGINYNVLISMSVYGAAIFFISMTDAWWSKHKESFFFTFGFVLLLIFALIRTWPFDVFLKMVKEDAAVEWLQFVVLVVSGIFSLLISLRLKSHNFKYHLLFLIISLVLFFIAGDEISWGQRLFSISTPESMIEINRQKEITLHNLKTIPEKGIWYGYLAVSLFGTFSFLLRSKIEKFDHFLSQLTIPWFISPLFAFPLIYNLYTDPLKATRFSEWAEVTELFLYLGICAFFIDLYSELTKKKQA